MSRKLKPCDFNFNGSINWYPGHMVKAWREMKSKLNSVHVLLEVRDARLPFSCANPEIEKVANSKSLMSRIIVLNKSDLANSHLKKVNI